MNNHTKKKILLYRKNAIPVKGNNSTHKKNHVSTKTEKKKKTIAID